MLPFCKLQNKKQLEHTARRGEYSQYRTLVKTGMGVLMQRFMAEGNKQVRTTSLGPNVRIGPCIKQ